jgi:hypothetical protein
MTARVGRQEDAADLFAALTSFEVDSSMTNRVLAAVAEGPLVGDRREAVYRGGAADPGNTIRRIQGVNQTIGQWVPSGCLTNRTPAGATVIVRQPPEN